MIVKFPTTFGLLEVVFSQIVKQYRVLIFFKYALENVLRKAST